MLNLFNLKETKKVNELKEYSIPIESNIYNRKTSKHFPSPLREWKNSIYVYNKNNLNLIPSTTAFVNNLIKGYFSLYNKNLEAKMRNKRLLLRLRRLSSNRFYISNGGFKHTNNKVIINLYIFNRQKTNYLLTLKYWYLKNFLTRTKRFSPMKGTITNKLINRFKLINEKGIQAVKKLNKDKYLLIKAINTISKDKNYNMNNFKELSNYTENFYKSLIQKSLKKIRIYFYYKQLLYINKSKLNYTYLQYLKKQLEKLYNKNVEFNIIDVKRFYLNSDILSESLTTKLSRNRKKMYRYLTNLKNKIKVRTKISLKNLSVNKPIYKLSNKKNYNLPLIINNLKYKHVTGFRIEAKGRLSKRFTASRSVNKLAYKGSLLNIDSSDKGISSVILKGNLKSNIQYTKLKSKSRIGSFGIKGWVSGN